VEQAAVLAAELQTLVAEEVVLVTMELQEAPADLVS
jgi:hypothetical protein